MFGRGALGLFDTDFTGGVTVQVTLKEPMDVAAVRAKARPVSCRTSRSAKSAAATLQAGTQFKIDTSIPKVDEVRRALVEEVFPGQIVTYSMMRSRTRANYAESRFRRRAACWVEHPRGRRERQRALLEKESARARAAKGPKRRCLRDSELAWAGPGRALGSGARGRCAQPAETTAAAAAAESESARARHTRW